MKILLIEDNASDRFVIREAIVEAGLNAEIQEIENGEDVLRFAEEAVDKPPDPPLSIILLDLNLPRHSGFNLLPVLKICFPNTPIMVISSADPSWEMAKLSQFTTHYFRKPHILDEYLAIGDHIKAIVEKQ